MRTRVKVKTAELRRVVVKRREAMIADHKKALDALPEQRAAYQAAVVAGLEKALALVKAGKLPERGWSGKVGEYVSVPVKGTAPSEPTLNTCQVDRLIKTLDMAADEAISLSPEDADDYFGPCKTNGRRRR